MKNRSGEMQLVMIPGIDGSDERHWQSHWEASLGANAVRIAPSSWSEPDLNDWSRAISEAVSSVGREVVLVAHSLGCLAATHWLGHSAGLVRGFFLVAPPDPTGPNFPSRAAPTFTRVALDPVRLPGLAVVSDDDPYCEPDSSVRLCRAWEIPRISIGNGGHLNSSSGLGSWEPGRCLLTAFLAGLESQISDGATAQ